MLLLPEFITSLLRSIRKIYLAREYHRRRQDMEGKKAEQDGTAWSRRPAGAG